MTLDPTDHRRTEMTTSTSLIDFLLNLLRDPEARDAFLADGEGYLSSCGLEDLSSADIQDALVLLQDNQEASFDREYNTGGNSVTVHTPPPPHADHGDHEDAVQYLNNYITNNYVNETIIDNSFNQQVDTGGGDFDQDVDIDNTIATGDGAVAVGGDVEDSEIVTGDDNVVGDDNVSGSGNVVGDNNDAVTGDDNTTSFGSGDATSTSVGGDVDVSNGGAFSTGGDATGEYDVDGSFNETETTTTTTTNNEDSFNTDVDTDVNSHNDTETNTDIDSHDETETHVASHNDADFHA
jgi:hypothetical protein